MLAGVGDPYWYEWSVGLLYCLDLLYPEKNIESIVMQHSGLQGLDDIVINYFNGKIECIQIKHTRKGNTLTFTNMIKGKESSESYLKQFSSDWKKALKGCTACNAVLFTNRSAGSNSYEVKVDEITSYERPALDKFWLYIKEKINDARKIDDIVVKDKWKIAWGEWLEQLDSLDDIEKLNFLKSFDIKASQEDLDKIIDSIGDKISNYFKVDKRIAVQLHQSLCYALMKWTTTLRKKQEITKEDLMEALSLSSDNFKGVHDIPTTEPFFKSRIQFVEDLERALIKREYPIIFLSGEPGVGKTNIVSQLTNKINSVITLRFYAFKPLSVEDMYLSADKGISDPKALWGDLLIQLRELLKGKLSHYKVPVSNELLQSTERLREEVLRLSSALYNETGNTTVICIDGIDHAARAGKRNTFLETLVPPEGVPENVCFLIVGQPIYEYKEYPYFLNSDNVLKIDVPKLKEDDIRQLYCNTSQQIPNEDTNIAIDIINKSSNGNTLSVVFAINEAKMCKNIDELEKCLNAKSISSGISSYYDYIWKSALDNLPSNFFDVDDIVAGVLSLINKKIDATIICDIYDDSTMSKNKWERILQKLYPIVIEEEGYFRVFHNDVRIYLENQLRKRMTSFAKVSEKIANYYIEKSDDARSRHELIFELLKYANKTDRYIEIFNKEYVVEALKIRRPIDELIEQLEITLDSISSTNEFKKIINLSCAVSTLNQFMQSIQWMDKEYIPDISMPNILNSEKKVIHGSLLTTSELKGMFSEICLLIDNKDIKRAKYILEKWLWDLTPEGIIDILDENKQLDSDVKEKEISEELKSLFEKWGRICQYTGIDYKLDIDYDNISDIKKQARAYFSKGWLEEGKKLTKDDEIIRTLDNLTVYFKRDFEGFLYSLMRSNQVDMIIYLTTNNKEKDFSNEFNVKIATWAIVNLRESLYKELIEEIYTKGFRYVEVKEYKSTSDIFHTYADIALILAFKGTEIENIIEDFFGYFKKNNIKKGDKQYQAIKCILLASGYLGHINQSIRSSEEIKYVNLNIYKSTIKFLFNSNNSIGRGEVGAFKIEEFLLMYYIRISQYLGKAYIHGLKDTMLEVAKDVKNLRHIDILWEYLSKNREFKVLEKIFNYWMLEDGEVWKLEIDQMYEIANGFINRAYEIGWNEKVNDSEKILQEKSIGYTGRKEYSLYNPLKWFEVIECEDKELWKSIGIELLNISKIASKLGDNRAGIFINSSVAQSAGKQGYKVLWEFANISEKWDMEWVQTIFDGIISSLESNDFTLEELEAIWKVAKDIFYIDSYAKTYDSNNNIRKIYITDIKEAILLAAERLGYEDIGSKLEKIAKAEYMLNRNELNNYAYRLPTRWFESKVVSDSYEIIGSMSCEDALEYVIEQYMLKDTIFRWDMVSAVIYKYENENFEEIQICIDRMFELLMQRNNKGYWESDGVSKVYETIFKYLDEEKVNLVFNKIISNYFSSRDDTYEYKLYGISSDLENFTYCYYRNLSLDDNVNALKTILDMHTSWITGNGTLKMKNHYKKMNEIELPKDWIDFVDKVSNKLDYLYKY